MILAHFTSTDTSSVGLIVGSASLFWGGRRFMLGMDGERGPARRRTAVRAVGTGVVLLVLGVAAGFSHT